MRVRAPFLVLETPHPVSTSISAATPKATVLAKARQMPWQPSADLGGPRAALCPWSRSLPSTPSGLTNPPPSPTAEEKKKLAEEKAMEIEEQNKIIAVEKAEAETALTEVMPILEAAKLELQKLDKSDVTEIR